MRQGEERARAQAAAFRERHRLGWAPFGDLQRFVEALGIDMVVQDLAPGLDAFAMQDPQTSRNFLAVGATRNAERQRFTIAHELGHIEFGSFVEGALPHPPEHPDEDEAHTFARHLLMPVEGMESVLEDLGARRGQVGLVELSALVQAFGVSPHVATIQLRDNLWLGDDIDADLTEWTDLSGGELAARFGWERERNALVEASSSSRPSQRLLTKAVDGYERGLITERLVASVAGMSVPDVRAALKRADISPAKQKDERISVEIDDL